MKIVIPIMDFGRAGGERVLSRLATELVNCGCDVYFVALGSAKDIYYQTTAKILKSKVSNSKNRIVRFIMNNYYLYKKCMELRPDCAIANFHLSAFMVSFLPRTVGKYYYIQAYETVFYKSLIRRFIAFSTYLLPLRKIVNHKNILPKSINNYVEIIPAGIDDQVFYSKTNKGERKTIGLVGREEKRKGTSNIIDEIIRWENKEDLVLNVALYLSEEDRLRLEKIKINYNVIEINNDLDLANFYRLNDLIIATGLVEDGAFHYPCAEAMSCGCAVISNYAPLTNTNSKLKIENLIKTLLLIN
ncbi:Glycosyl transferases group 1 [Cedecea lapagei]|uniref:Glycosyl transferases group 1 n=1 Tax=Cedecea lapagei TaxID=158823 RepID=A0A447V0H5_9ENTR|nr:glycosyltransferase [Cedecea lapagei]VEB96362.1 Glycosyl transferases group 1 [Cedecea lapagei]